MDLSWAKPPYGNWYALEHLDFSDVQVDGVYIIWHEGFPGRVVHIGQGDIAQSLEYDRRNPRILQFREQGTLRVTWAYVPQYLQDGIERYFVETYRPLIDEERSETRVVPVRTPWCA